MDFSCREASGPSFLASEATEMPVRKPSAYITASRKNNENAPLLICPATATLVFTGSVCHDEGIERSESAFV